MLLQILERDDLQSGLVRCSQHYRRSRAGLERLLPARRTQAPAVVGFEPGKAMSGLRCGQIIASLAPEFQKRGGHLCAYDMAADVLRAGMAAAVAEKASQRLRAAFSERPTQHVASATWRRAVERHICISLANAIAMRLLFR